MWDEGNRKSHNELQQVPGRIKVGFCLGIRFKNEDTDARDCMSVRGRHTMNYSRFQGG